MFTNSGFIKLPRDIINWRWYTDANVFRIYVHLLLKAAYKDSEWMYENIKKGQVITGRKSLAAELDISESMVTRCLEKLKETGDISLKTTNRYTVVTILKWAEYQEQDYFFYQQSDNARTTTEQQSYNNRTHINKENNKKNLNNVNNSAPARKKERVLKNSTGILPEINEMIEAGII